jgi:hypothetical protein
MENPTIEKKASGKMSTKAREYKPKASTQSALPVLAPPMMQQVPSIDQMPLNHDNYVHQDGQHYDQNYPQYPENPQFVPYVGEQQNNYYQQDPGMVPYEHNQGYNDQQFVDPSQIQYNGDVQGPNYVHSVENPEEPQFDDHHNDEFQKKAPQGKYK